MIKPVDIKTGSYFSTPMMIGGGVVAAAGVAIVTVNVYVGLVALIAGVLMLTTHYRVSIDYSTRSYHDYVWVLGLKSGDKGTFESVQYIFVNTSKVSQTMHGRVASTTIVQDEFNAYLKFSEKHKIHLGSDGNKANLMNRMGHIAATLKCDLLDYTSQ
jgi:hypothetical protein